ncbi:MAG: PAS domain S-box protein, partial [Gemmatimonadota bacterium]
MDELSCQDLRTLYRDTPTALVLVDREGRITNVNEQGADLFGWSVDAL